MRLRTTWRAAPAAAIAMLALAGCGGSGHKRAAPLQVGQVNAPVVAPAKAARHQRSTVHHAAVHHARAVKRAAPGKRTFTAVATGNPQALRGLAQKVSKAAGGRSGAVNTLSTPIQVKIHFTSTGGTDDAAFVSAADSVCSSYRATVRQIGGSATNLLAQENETQDLMNATAASLQQLRSLSPPASVASLAGRYVDLVTESVDDYIAAQSRSSSASEAVGTAAETQDVNMATVSAQDGDSAKAVAQQLGFHVCGSEGAEWL
ncbi:MAG TPA: hypothetical protein VG223_15335 [Solirubrobacteraceae bacterium]|jgi:hypothetical protein|nr:hypothetical protein [Solirubrobacteraceae bacterium]